MSSSGTRGEGGHISVSIDGLAYQGLTGILRPDYDTCQPAGGLQRLPEQVHRAGGELPVVLLDGSAADQGHVGYAVPIGRRVRAPLHRKVRAVAVTFMGSSEEG